MDEKPEEIILISKDNNEISVNKRFCDFSIILKNADLTEKIPCVLIEENILNLIITFYKMYNFDKEMLQLENFHGKVTSGNLSENFPQKILNLFKDYIINDNEINIEKIQPIVNAAYHFEFEELKNVVLKMIATCFYCGKNEEDFDMYKEKWNLPNEIDPDEQVKIINEFPEVFEAINKELMELIDNEDIN